MDTLRLVSVSSNYVSGWQIEENDYLSYLSGGTPASPGKLSITRPTVNTPVKVTLKLFAEGTDASAINDGTATALATQDFTFILEADVPEAEYKVLIAVQDEEKNPITDATVTLEKDGWNKVTPENDGSYKLEDGASYKLTVKKDGYADYTETFIYNENSAEPTLTKTVTLSPIVMQNVRFSVKDKVTGNTIDHASVKVKQDYYTTISPETDGSYKLQKGISYNWTVEATNYKTANGTITPSEDTTIDVELEKNITNYTVTFQPMDGDTAITSFDLKVEEEVEDDYGDSDWETVSANDD